MFLFFSNDNFHAKQFFLFSDYKVTQFFLSIVLFNHEIFKHFEPITSIDLIRQLGMAIQEGR